MRTIITSALLCLLFVSCEKEIPFEIDDDGNKLVINSFIGPNMNEVHVQVSQSKSVISTESLQNLPNATVTLFKDGVSLGQLTSVGEGKFIITHTPEVGSTYRLQASANGLDDVVAETTIPAVPNIETLTNPEFSDEEFKFDIVINDIPNQDNFYQLLLIVTQDEFGTNPFITGFNSESPILPGNSDPFGESENYYFDDAFFTDNAFNGGTASIDMEAYLGSIYFSVQYLHCSEEYYLYKRTLDNYIENSGNPFSQPVQIFSNVEGGLGIFAGYSFDQISAIL